MNGPHPNSEWPREGGDSYPHPWAQYIGWMCEGGPSLRNLTCDCVAQAYEEQAVLALSRFRGESR